MINLTEKEIREIIKEEVMGYINEMLPQPTSPTKKPATKKPATMNTSTRPKMSSTAFIKARRSQDSIAPGIDPAELQILAQMDQLLQSWAQSHSLTSGRVGQLLKSLQQELTPKEG
tara:strand:+ start:253 stop:600 length:348 start_codon:yes stop_codon:yes gene_type:complete